MGPVRLQAPQAFAALVCSRPLQSRRRARRQNQAWLAKVAERLQTDFHDVCMDGRCVVYSLAVLRLCPSGTCQCHHLVEDDFLWQQVEGNSWQRAQFDILAMLPLQQHDMVCLSHHGWRFFHWLRERAPGRKLLELIFCRAALTPASFLRSMACSCASLAALNGPSQC